MSFGERLQALRRENGLTQEEFAQELKVSRQAVSKWESARGYPEIEKIIYICNHYRVSMEELFQDEVPPLHLSPQTDPAHEEQPLAPSSLKKAFGSFFTNLSPANQLRCTVGLILVGAILLILLCSTLSKGGSDLMYWKLIWVALLILFTAGEAVTVGLTSIWFSAGALAALIAALLGGALWLQVLLFIVVSAACLLAVRPLAKKYLNPAVQPTNADRVIGKQAQVTEEINDLAATGAVSIGGVIWTARTGTEAVIPVGTLVRVLRIEGVKVFVEVI